MPEDRLDGIWHRYRIAWKKCLSSCKVSLYLNFLRIQIANAGQHLCVRIIYIYIKLF